MRLSKLILHNYRQFEDYAVPLRPEVNLLVGDNNAGKTSILYAASLAIGTYLLEIAPTEAGSFFFWDPKHSFNPTGGDSTPQPQYPVSVSAEGTVSGKALSWSRVWEAPNARPGTVPMEALQDLAWETLHQAEQGDSSAILPLLCSYGTDQPGPRRGRKVTDPVPSVLPEYSRMDGYTDCLRAVPSEDRILEWFETRTAEEEAQGTTLPEVEAVRLAIAKAFTVLTKATDVSAHWNNDAFYLELSYRLDGKPQTLPMQLLGDGLKRVLGLVGDIAYRMALLNPQLQENVLRDTPGVVIIDDVERNLHPEQQQKIIGLLRDLFPNVQLILSTHAPMVINSVRKENVIMLVPGKMATNPPVEVYGNDASSILCSVQGTTAKPVKVQKMFDEFYKVLEEKDLEKANKCLKDLENLIGEANPDLVSAQAALFFDSM